MKRAGFALALALFIGALIIYIIYRFPPYDTDKLEQIASVNGVVDESIFTDNIDQLIQNGVIIPTLDAKIAYIIASLGLVFCVSLVAGIHMLIDKLFYKKFFEEPLIWPAVRRGVLIYLVLLGWFLFRLIDSLTWMNLLLTLILALVLELMLIKFTDKPQ